nr:homolog of EHV2 ORF30 protein UL91 [Macronycteris gammaherpesvirus 1]
MSVTEKDFCECENFFAQPLPKLLEICINSLHNLGQIESLSQQVEKASLFLELVGTECIKEVLLSQPSPHPNPNVEDQMGASLKN